MTLSLLSLCGASCFLLCFTDSFRDNKGNICYGFATFKGLWIIDGSATLPHELDAKYQARPWVANSSMELGLPKVWASRKNIA